MTKTTIFLSFLLLLGHANSESQFNEREQAVLLKLKQHWQNPPSLSHWQNPPSLSHLNPLNSSHHCNLPEITCTSGTVTQLLLQNKNITQTVPPFICDLKNLTVIDLSNNSISQEFPKALYNCSKLEHLDLSQNYFNGTIPVDIHRLSRLRSLNLGANSFSGNIPPSIGQSKNFISQEFLKALYHFSKFEDLDISQNYSNSTLPVDIHEFSGWIPAGVSSWRNSVVFEACNNLPYLTTLLLDQNQLSGFLPSDIISWKTLNTLNLSRNKISGPIPEELGNLAGLTELDLSENQLSGQIPSQLGLLKLTLLNLSSNHLIGRIPTQFENDAYASSFLNNLALCANKPSLNINSCNNSDHHKSSKVPSKYLALIISLVAAGLLRLIVSISMIFKQGEHATMSVVPGSGEIAPEEIIVYNFGVFLLELATGREANDGDEQTFLAEWALDHILQGIPIVDALDEEVLIPGYLDEMSSIFILGIICTNTKPSMRPSIEEVLQILPFCTEFLPSSSVQTTRMRQKVTRIFWEKMLQEYDVAA